MVQILKEADFSKHSDARLIQLSAEYDGNGQEVRARLNAHVVTFYRTFPDSKPKQFWMTSADFDNLVDAWLQYKTDQMQAEAAEQARQQEVLAEAYRLAREFKVDFEGLKIEIKEETTWDERPMYTVHVPAIPLTSDHAYSVDALLQYVKETLGYVEDNIIWRENKGGQTDKDQRMIAAYRAVYPLQADESKAGGEEPERDYSDF